MDALVAMPGIDAYFVGPTDLSIALGVPGASFDDEKLGAALDRVIAATRAGGKYAMTLIGNDLEPAYARRVAGRGVQMMILGTDADLFMSAIVRFSALKSQG